MQDVKRPLSPSHYSDPLSCAPSPPPCQKDARGKVSAARRAGTKTKATRTRASCERDPAPRKKPKLAPTATTTPAEFATAAVGRKPRRTQQQQPPQTRTCRADPDCFDPIPGTGTLAPVLGGGHDPAALEGADDEVVMEEGVVAHPPQSERLTLVDQCEPMVRRWTRLEPLPSEDGDLLDYEREEQFVVLLAARPTAPQAGAEAAVRVRDEQFAALARRAAEEDLGDAVEEALTLANWASGELLALSELTGCLAGMPSEDLDPSERTKATKNLAAQIVALLQKGPTTRSHISSCFSINRRRTSTILSVLKGVGLIDEVRLPSSKEKLIVLNQKQMAICSDLPKYATMLHQLKAMRVRLLLHLRSLDGETSPSDDIPPARPSQYDNPIEILDLPYSAAAHAKPCSPVDTAMTLEPTLPRASPPQQPTDIDAAAVGAGAASAVVDEFEGEQGDALGSYVSFLLGAMQVQPEIGVAPQPRVAGCDEVVTREPLDIEYAIAAIYDDLLDQQQPNHPPWLSNQGNANPYANDLDLNEGDFAYISHLSHNDAARVLDLNEYDDGYDVEGDDDMPPASAYDRGAAAQPMHRLGADAAAGGAWPVGNTGELDQLFCEEQMTLLTTETFEDVLLPDEESPQFD